MLKYDRTTSALSTILESMDLAQGMTMEKDSWTFVWRTTW